MTTRVNGGFASGQWQAGELWYFVITVTGGDLTVNAGEPNALDENMFEALAQIGTPVIARVVDATHMHIALAYAGETDVAVIDAAIDPVIKELNGGWGASAATGSFTVA